MTELVAIDYRAPNAAQLFTESLKNTGFGVLRNHPLSQERVLNLYQSWQVFFNQSEQAKNSFSYKSIKQDGFFSRNKAESAKGSSHRDIKEYYHYYPWGQCPTELQGITQAYYQAANSLAAELLAWVEEFTPLEISHSYTQSLSSMIENCENTLLRILHYPPLLEDEEPEAIRAAAHEDINLLTILPAANEPGLQVKTLEGDWLDVPSDFGYLIVNIGDMLQEASAGYFPSTTHRVINPKNKLENKSRISMPLFLHAKPDVVLSERYTAHEYLMQRLKELGVL
ncbi:isopenicillin N synthase family dioxygenase [Catenovulum maritimum]|uniref:2-oxoglutarate-dependent ethylene/succinate-forming enzyme n=1 Tax=Catenovulum maritimum TaxID=1513271 RepID=A0A0J8GR58_9ALTE|nr:2OG-Fe(II) oxygenase family protein [Catenovulum maritimum]KMT65197.1 2OG-Fe(II) oxygenase [Catenovulum maritimum]